MMHIFEGQSKVANDDVGYITAERYVTYLDTLA